MSTQQWKNEMTVRYEVCCMGMWQRLCNYDDSYDYGCPSPIWVEEFKVLGLSRCPDCGATLMHEFVKGDGDVSGVQKAELSQW
jgi:hypothetical protein